MWLLVLVGVCAASLWFGKDLVTSRPPSPQPEADPVDFSLAPDESAIHLIVLNGTPRAGLARDVSLQLGRAGCVAENVGNATHRSYAKSMLINRRLTDRQAADLARRLGGIMVIREWDERTSEDAVLVLGSDWNDLVTVLSKEKGPRG